MRHTRKCLNTPLTAEPASRRGFTAIELAVVMGLIILMAGITLPAISRSMRKSHLSETVNNFVAMHQQAMLAAQQYRMTWDVAGVITVKVLADKIELNGAGGNISTYVIPISVEKVDGVNFSTDPASITTISYAEGTGLPDTSQFPTNQIKFRTLDGKDRTRIYIAPSGLTKSESY